MRGINTMHILPADKPRKDAPTENQCQTPGCHRQAYRIDRGVVVCAVCWQKRANKRRRGW
jgi:hypothetical protein